MMENVTYIRDTTMTKIELMDTSNDARATPSKPKGLISKNVATHVNTVQTNIKHSVTLTFPIALRKLVRGVEIEENTVLREKNTMDATAGPHF